MTQRSALEFSDYRALRCFIYERTSSHNRQIVPISWIRTEKKNYIFIGLGFCLFGLSSLAYLPHPVCPGLSHLLVSSTRRIILLSGLPWMAWWLPSIVLSARRTPYWHLITMANLIIRLTRAERSMLKLVMFICSLRFSLSTLSNPGLPRAPFCLYDGAPDCAISSWLLVATSRIKWQLV